jgi:hypothetical protein
VVKCIFTLLSARAVTEPVLPSDPLDLNSLYAAPPKQLADQSCLGGYDGSIRE